MSNHYLVPYNYLQILDSWTVENLIFERNQKEERAPLKELVIFNKERINTENLDRDKEYPYIEIKSISLEKGSIEPTYIKGSELPARAKLIGRKGDVLVSIVRPERGIIAIVPPELDECVVSNTFVVLTPKKVSPEYLYLLLKDSAVRQEFSLLARGTTTPTLGIKELKNYSLPLKKIPEYMDRAAEELYKEWKREGIEKRALKDIVEDIFEKELLEVKDVAEESQQIQYITLSYEKLADRWDVQYHIDHISHKVTWSVPVKKLGDIGELKVGAPLVNNSDEERAIPYIRVQDLDDDHLTVVTKERYFVDETIIEKTPRSLLNKDDILISRIGSFGRSALVQKELDGALANHNLMIFRPNTEVVLPEFLTYFFKSKWAKKQFNTFATGLVLQRNFLKEMLVPAPSLPQQSLIIESIKQEASTNRMEELEKETLRFTHQIECVERVAGSLLSGNRKALVQIPPGIGKTSILVSILRRLFNLGQVKKVLYLNDRRILAEQFKQALQERLPEQPCHKLDSENRTVKNDGVFVGIYNETNQAMISSIDLIILDGYNPKWALFANGERNNGLILGIISTSKLPESNYIEALNMFDGPTYSYEMNQAILDNHFIELE